VGVNRNTRPNGEVKEKNFKNIFLTGKFHLRARAFIIDKNYLNPPVNLPVFF
jgi:hypothetical protein